MREKQKLRFNYGLTEKQLRRLMYEARSGTGNPADRLVRLVESRLDNVVFRAGFARTIPAARQLVNHGHFCINGSKVDIPSYRIEVGHLITFRERSQSLSSVTAAVEEPLGFDTRWLDVDKEKRTVMVQSMPESDAIPFELNLQLVIEYYSQRM